MPDPNCCSNRQTTTATRLLQPAFQDRPSRVLLRPCPPPQVVPPGVRRLGPTANSQASFRVKSERPLEANARLAL